MGFSGGVFTRTDGTRTGATVCQQQQGAGTGIDPTLFDNELNEIVGGLETALLKDGTNAATADLNMGGNKLTNLAAGSSSSDAVTFSQLATLSPAGSIVMYGGASAPSGWLLCDGSAVSRAGYSSLFAVVGTTFGVGDGATTFNLPDLRQRFPLGKAASGTGSTLGGTGGSIDHVHTGPSHTHSVPALSVPSHTHSVPAHYHGLGTGADLATDTEAAHSHTVSDPAASGGAFKDFFTTFNGVNADLTGAGTDGTKYDLSSVAIQTGAGGAHSHSMTGRIGLVTGGVDGNSAMTSGSWSGSTGTGTTGADGTGNTGANNPPYISLNFIIKT